MSNSLTPFFSEQQCGWGPELWVAGTLWHLATVSLLPWCLLLISRPLPGWGHPGWRHLLQSCDWCGSGRSSSWSSHPEVETQSSGRFSLKSKTETSQTDCKTKYMPWVASYCNAFLKKKSYLLDQSVSIALKHLINKQTYQSHLVDTLNISHLKKQFGKILFLRLCPHELFICFVLR